MGSRVRNVMAELHGEKMDIVDYSDDPAGFVGNALSPARVTAVDVIDAEARVAQVTVPDYQLSLAIGKEGQNARLAARLTGWRIDIRSDAQQPEGPSGKPGPAAEPEGSGGTAARAARPAAQSTGAADAPAR
jgi:N utilization substance protein A